MRTIYYNLYTRIYILLTNKIGNLIRQPVLNRYGRRSSPAVIEHF